MEVACLRDEYRKEHVALILMEGFQQQVLVNGAGLSSWCEEGKNKHSAHYLPRTKGDRVGLQGKVRVV